MKRSFPDVNVWFALAVEDHEHHTLAAAWWDETDGAIGFCWLTHLGLLRLLTSSQTMNGKPLSNDKAWLTVEKFFADERVKSFPEPDGLSARIQEFSRGKHPSPKVWVDAYLAAYAAAQESELISFDRAFLRFGIPCRILL